MVKRILFALLVLSSASAQAEQVERNDILIALGIGIGPTDANFYASDDDIVTYERPTTVSSFKLGGMFAPQHAIYYQYRMGLLRMYRSDWDDNGWGYSTFSGLGYTYYFEPTVGSPYIEAAAGFRGVKLFEHFPAGVSEGFGFLIGAGNEFNEHLQLGAVLEVSDSANQVNRESLRLMSVIFQLEFKF